MWYRESYEATYYQSRRIESFSFKDYSIDEYGRRKMECWVSKWVRAIWSFQVDIVLFQNKNMIDAFEMLYFPCRILFCGAGYYAVLFACFFFCYSVLYCAQYCLILLVWIFFVLLLYCFNTVPDQFFLLLLSHKRLQNKVTTSTGKGKNPPLIYTLF